MSKKQFLLRVKESLTRKNKQIKRRRTAGRGLHLESLEDRCLLSVSPFSASVDAATLNSDAASGPNSDTLPQISTDNAGNWVAIWNRSTA